MKESNMETFHHIVAKLLYVSKRARVDIDPTVASLCTRLSCSTEEDWTKLKRLLEYLRGTINMPRIIGANGLDIFETYVDASYTVHQDKRGHAGGLMTLGLGVVQGKATIQKLNTKSSTESEVVGASDYIPWTVWSKRFLAEQGNILRRIIFYQDIQSVTKMESNGRKSRREKSRHTDIRYFCIKDIIRRDDIEVVHCLTKRMIADYYTKPSQGSLFKKMRDILLGITPFPTEERFKLNEKTIRKPNGISTRVKAVENSSTETGKIPVTYADKVRMGNIRGLTIDREPVIHGSLI